jgi:hypothetical protein
MARRCEFAKAGGRDRESATTIRFAAPFAVANIAWNRESPPVARQVARLERRHVNIAGIVQIGK